MSRLGSSRQASGSGGGCLDRLALRDFVHSPAWLITDDPRLIPGGDFKMPISRLWIAPARA